MTYPDNNELLGEDLSFNNLNDSKWKPKYLTEFNMNWMDFKRYDDWLSRAEFSSARINSCEVPSLLMVQTYFAEINVLYKSWRPLLLVPVMNAIDDAIVICRSMKRKWENSESMGMPINKYFILDLVDKLDTIHTKLLELKQIIGLGIQVKKNLTTKERIRAGIKLKDDLNISPDD